MSKSRGLGPSLKQYRVDKNLTQRDVTRQSGVSCAYLSQLENGQILEPKLSILAKLAKAYDCPYRTLFILAGYPLPDPDR
jgi:transcriptional regulator with XRE-family HTH domain